MLNELAVLPGNDPTDVPTRWQEQIDEQDRRPHTHSGPGPTAALRSWPPTITTAANQTSTQAKCASQREPKAPTALNWLRFGCVRRRSRGRPRGRGSGGREPVY